MLLKGEKIVGEKKQMRREPRKETCFGDKHQRKGIIKQEWRYPKVVVLLYKSPLKNELPVSK